ncbi:CACTA en-spm transposon protein [Cucumis melo var. makuwa]|uniref:CACTA en-spm transposon protein n=1 Tax=Cucumis melo var. makuwa TaxID=1194695 RepID=A0A5A7UQ51_CUCMM|nr:CACTA en-spm transposon protein [Cucumis melo var. makuwa]
MSTSRLTLYAELALIPQSLKDRLCIISLTTSSTMWMNTCHMQTEQAMTMNYSDKPRTMSSFSRAFLEMSLEFVEDLDNPAEGSSSVGDNSGSSQPFMTPTPKRRAQSRLLELELYVVADERILMTITLGAEKPMSPHVVFFSQAIGVCVRKRYNVT